MARSLRFNFRRASRLWHNVDVAMRQETVAAAPLTLVDTDPNVIEQVIRWNIRRVLEARGLEAPDLYKPIGLTDACYSGKIRGRARFTLIEFLRICEILNIPAREMTNPGLDPNRQNWKLLRVGMVKALVRTLVRGGSGLIVSEGGTVSF